MYLSCYTGDRGLMGIIGLAIGAWVAGKVIKKTSSTGAMKSYKSSTGNNSKGGINYSKETDIGGA